MNKYGEKETANHTHAICRGIIILCILGAAAAIAFLAFHYYQSTAEEKAALQQDNLYESVRPESGESGNSEDRSYLDDALAVNPDTVAWLTIPDTVIDFPIVQCEDNSYYLSHGFDRSEYARGCPFLDYRNSSDFTDFNSIIYGHHIRGGQVFSGVEYYKEQAYFDAHPTGELILPYEKYTVEFFACVVVESDSFLYSVVHPGVSDRELYLEMIQEAMVAGTGFAPEDLTEERLLVLSTCSYEYDGARTALIGRLVEEG